MQSFVTPPGIVRAAHIFRPFETPVGSIRYSDLAVEISCSDIRANYPVTGLLSFGVLSTPTINDSKEKISVLFAEVGIGSTTRVSGGTVRPTLVFGRGAAQSSAERWHRATHQVRPEHLTFRCDRSWPHAAIKDDARQVISRRRANQLRGSRMAGLPWWSGQRK
jgi:hypothetical protein